MKNTFESSDLIYLLRINYHFAKKKKAHNKDKQFFFPAKKCLRPSPNDCVSAAPTKTATVETKTCRSSLCASAGVANKSGRCAATSWSCSDTSQPGEVASVYQTSYTSVAFPPTPSGAMKRRQLTPYDSLK